MCTEWVSLRFDKMGTPAKELTEAIEPVLGDAASLTENADMSDDEDVMRCDDRVRGLPELERMLPVRTSSAP